MTTFNSPWQIRVHSNRITMFHRNVRDRLYQQKVGVDMLNAEEREQERVGWRFELSSEQSNSDEGLTFETSANA